MLKKILTIKIGLLGVIGVFLVGAWGVLMAPQFHANYLRSKVGAQVVYILDAAGSSGGTGFAVQTPSHKVVIVTNRHVCGVANNFGILFVKKETGPAFPMQIIKRSDNSDLCAITPLKDMSGLKLAHNVEIGQDLAILGHPLLLPLNLSLGQLMGYDKVEVLVNKGRCKVNKGMFKTVPAPFGLACIQFANSGITNVVALPGNSGSPVVDFYGHVVGVNYATNMAANWAIIVPLEAVRDFLKGM